jgi:hypothetical protein
LRSDPTESVPLGDYGVFVRNGRVDKAPWRARSTPPIWRGAEKASGGHPGVMPAFEIADQVKAKEAGHGPRQRQAELHREQKKAAPVEVRPLA